ncbi:MAG: cytidine deaminase [Clostridia bacterium]|nr:cytidine deaminase [Clostridia bacterium]
MTDDRLLQLAEEARQNSYSPYSCTSVGAALLTKSGKVYTGANVECASYPAGICAERSALAAAVSAGERELAAIAVAGGAHGEPSTVPFYPCGMCRQALYEFSPEMRVITADGTVTLKELLPLAFNGEAIKK